MSQYRYSYSRKERVELSATCMCAVFLTMMPFEDIEVSTCCTANVNVSKAMLIHINCITIIAIETPILN